MLQVVKTEIPHGLVVQLIGVVDDAVHFEDVIGPPPRDTLLVNCAGITRFNSIGIKSWISYFQTVAAKGTRLIFEECSTAMMEQVNSVMNFRCGGAIDSLYLGFTCSKCRHVFNELAHTVDLKKQPKITEIPDRKCPKCGSDASFDDFPEEYFAFLKRT
jgi:anti-anti-sigma regulatory factor